MLSASVSGHISAVLVFLLHYKPKRLYKFKTVLTEGGQLPVG